jgi:CubicO group peptidase (beta-lactamase class C family)
MPHARPAVMGGSPGHCEARLGAVALLTVTCLACSVTDPSAPSLGHRPSPPAPEFSVALSTYFPPPETSGGWRTATRAVDTRALGVDSARAAALGSYVMSVPYESYWTGVSGYSAANKAALIIRHGWVVGEYYNQASARTAVYYLASNGKTFTMMLVGRMMLDYPGLGISLSSQLYDSRWLAAGYPLSDSLKASITFDQVFRHVSGIVPQVEAAVADGAVPNAAGWDFVPFTLGFDPDWPVSAPLYYAPGKPSTYTKGSTYSSVAFNHFSIIFRTVSGLEPSEYLRRRMLDPIGFGRMAYKVRTGLGGYQWATAGNGLSGARDFARLGYLLLHEGAWGGQRIFDASWIRQFTGQTGYPNVRSNRDCYWGGAYPTDMYLTTGSGINRLVVVPSLDLVATINGRLKWSMNAEVTANFLDKLFAAVTDSYLGCDGILRNNQPGLAGLTLMNSDTDKPIGPLTDGMTIDLASLPTRRLNIRADPTGTVASVRFGLDANSSYRLEKTAPYSLAGDNNGDFNPWTPTAGTHTVTATPYPDSQAAGTAGPRVQVRLTVR